MGISVEEIETTTLHTLHRVRLTWEAGGYLSTVDPDFHRVLQHMIVHFGPPSKVEFLRDEEGWE